MDAFPDPQANYLGMQLQVRRVEVVVVCIGQPSFVYVLWVHCDFDLMIFLEREVKEQEDGIVVGVGCPLPNSCCHSFLLKTSALWQSPRSSLSKGAKSYHAVRSQRCPKSDAVQKKKKKSQNLAGIWLNWACESEASDSSGRVPCRADNLVLVKFGFSALSVPRFFGV